MRARSGTSVLVLILALAGCAHSTRRASPPVNPASPVTRVPERVLPEKSPSGDTTVIVVPVRAVSGLGVNAITWIGEEDGLPYRLDIEAFSANDQTWCRNVCGHELGHFLGLKHTAVRGTWMFEFVSPHQPLIDGPTIEETVSAYFSAREMRFVAKPERGTPPEIVAALRWAAGRWNASLGREVLTVMEGER